MPPLEIHTEWSGLLIERISTHFLSYDPWCQAILNFRNSCYNLNFKLRFGVDIWVVKRKIIKKELTIFLKVAFRVQYQYMSPSILPSAYTVEVWNRTPVGLNLSAGCVTWLLFTFLSLCVKNEANIPHVMRHLMDSLLQYWYKYPIKANK